MQQNLPKTMSFAVLAASFEGGLAIFALSLGWVFGLPPLASFSWSWIDLVWGVAAAIPPLGIFGLCLFLPWAPLRRITAFLDAALLPLFRECGLIEIAVICFLAGLGEEMLFRPIVQDGLARLNGPTYGPAMGLIGAAVVFGLLHRITPLYALLAGLIGLYLGGIWLLTGNLLVPIAAHAIYDFVAIVILLKMHKPPTIESTNESRN